MTTITIAIPMALTMVRVLRLTQGRTCGRVRERIRTVGPFVLALAVVVLATFGYLELVSTLLAGTE